MRELICISCPRGCHLKVDEKTLEVTGNSCPRGKIYGISEVTNPVRVITSTVKISGGDSPRVSVKTDKPISKSKIFDVMKLLDDVELKAPVNVGDVVLSNILETDVNIVVTKKM